MCYVACVCVCTGERDIHRKARPFPATCLSVCSSDCLLVAFYATASSLEDYSFVLFVE